MLLQERWNAYNPLFNDVHVMVFLGIGFLLTFLKNYSLTALTFNLIIGAISVQWYILGKQLEILKWSKLSNHFLILSASGFVQMWAGGSNSPEIRLTLSSFLLGEYAAATVLISFCVVLGKLSILQLIIMALLEVLLYSVNEYIGFSLLFAHDVGYTNFIHVFAASFGLGVSRALKVENVAQPSQLATSKPSNIFSLLGTLFLWVFWPSFMASASLPGLPQQRAMMNTYLGKVQIDYISP